MPGIDNVGAAFKAFMGSISHERKAIISTLNNGFEGWLKLEFYTWLIQAYDLDYTAAHYHDRDAGMEYTIDLDQRFAAIDRTTKQCDLWVRDGETSKYHYIELKAPFANTNQGKLMQSAADDYWYMSRLKASTELVATGSAIVFGVGFSDNANVAAAQNTHVDSWQKHIDYVRSYSGLSTELTHSDESEHKAIKWAVLTHRY